MKKLFRFILYFTLIACPLFSGDNILLLNNQNFIQEVAEPVEWTPKHTVLYEPTKILLHSDYGKLFYIINDTLGNIEPAAYTDGIILHGEAGRIVDYDVTALLERPDGRLEAYSRMYRVDRGSSTRPSDKQNVPFDRNLKYIQNDVASTVEVNYSFDTNNYAVSIDNRKITWPLGLVEHDSTELNETLDQLSGQRPIYMSLIRFDTMRQENAVVETFDAKVAKPDKPQFGSVQFGQTFQQNVPIQIKSNKPTDKIYYWKTDIASDGFIFAPPKITEVSKWHLYREPIKLNSVYVNGTIGLAAFTLADNGQVSEVSGPYYLKVTNSEVDTKQLFTPQDDHIYTNQTYLNNQNLQYYSVVYDQADLEFVDYSKYEQFYFKFNDTDTYGKSALIDCDGKFSFANKSTNPLELEFFTASGKSFAKIVVLSSKMTFPYARDFKSTTINLNRTSNVVFYMPSCQIKYEASVNDDYPLIVKQNSPDFKGVFNAECPTSANNIYRIRFAIFDNVTQQIVKQSQVYTITVSPPKSNIQVVTKNVDLSVYHNDKQALELAVSGSKNKRDKIYYRVDNNSVWVEYTEPIEIIPPKTGVYKVQIFAKVEDIYGNIYENEQPFEVHFDRRALYVDSDLESFGNGTQLYPYNNIEAAIKTARQKDIHIINIVSSDVKAFLPIEIDGDLIIQPDKSDSTATINLQCKAINRKNFSWFKVKPRCLFELRNTQFNVVGGNNLISSNSAKVKLYNTNINLILDRQFTLLDTINSKLGVDGLSVEGYNLQYDFTGIKSVKTQMFLSNSSYILDGTSFKLFDINSCQDVLINGVAVDLSCSKEFTFANCNNSKFNLTSTQINLGGTFSNASGLILQSGSAVLTDCNFVYNANKASMVSISNQTKSTTTVSRSSFKINNAVRAIGFAQNKSNLTFDQSSIDIGGCLEYGYNFRMQNCSLDIASSVVRLLNCDSGANFALNNATFQAVNNSVFNYGNKNSKTMLWLTDATSLTSINSVYYCDDNDGNCFIFGNNKSECKCLLLSNVVPNNIKLVDSPESSLDTIDLNDFDQNNIEYEFNYDFNLDDEKSFFIPTADSILLQAGINSTYSPIALPEKDFLDNIRQNNRSGIDIGAVQRSGWF